MVSLLVWRAICVLGLYLYIELRFVDIDHEIGMESRIRRL